MRESSQLVKVTKLISALWTLWVVLLMPHPAHRVLNFTPPLSPPKTKGWAAHIRDLWPQSRLGAKGTVVVFVTVTASARHRSTLSGLCCLWTWINPAALLHQPRHTCAREGTSPPGLGGCARVQFCWLQTRIAQWKHKIMNKGLHNWFPSPPSTGSGTV